MNPKTSTGLYLYPAELTFPYIAPAFGKHTKTWNHGQLEQQRDQFLRTGPGIPDGFGKHRQVRSWPVVLKEDETRAAIKRDRLQGRVA